MDKGEQKMIGIDADEPNKVLLLMGNEAIAGEFWRQGWV